MEGGPAPGARPPGHLRADRFAGRLLEFRGGDRPLRRSTPGQVAAVVAITRSQPARPESVAGGLGADRGRRLHRDARADARARAAADHPQAVGACRRPDRGRSRARLSPATRSARPAPAERGRGAVEDPERLRRPAEHRGRAGDPGGRQPGPPAHEVDRPRRAGLDPRAGARRGDPRVVDPPAPARQVDCRRRWPASRIY